MSCKDKAVLAHLMFDRLWKSRDMLDAGDKKAHDRKVLAAKIRDLKAKRESEFSRGTASVGGSTSETASNINIQIVRYFRALFW